jgi:hypothetical protein
MQYIDQYKAIALSIGHLSEEHVISLKNMFHSIGMATIRDTGWFLKLYELEDSDASYLETWREYCPFVSDSLMMILKEVYFAGFRMIEFDQDVKMISGLTVEDIAN